MRSCSTVVVGNAYNYIDGMCKDRSCLNNKIGKPGHALRTMNGMSTWGLLGTKACAFPVSHEANE